MEAALFKAGSTVLITSADRDIDFDGQTYLANNSLLNIEGPVGGGDFPGYTFQVLCPDPSPQRTLFLKATGPEPAAIFLVEAQFAQDGTLSWRQLWSFKGVLGQGSMVEELYQGRLQHIFEQRLYSPPRRYWNATSQKARTNNQGDEGAAHVATVSAGQLSGWQGTRMKHDDDQ